MARRSAQRHGLAPTSDYDAVRLLRARGIDPFQGANMLELVTSNDDPRQGDQANLPGPARSEAPPPAPATEDTGAIAEQVQRMQADIARRRRRRMIALAARLALLVLLPSLIVGWYYFRVATPLYATDSTFVIQKAEAQAAGGLGSMFSGTGLAVQQDAITVQSYLQSRDAMRRLDRDQGFRAHFSQPGIDPILRLPADASGEDVYDLYREMLKISYDPTEGILKMEVIAADPETSAAFAEALITYAEERVDNLTQRLREDQMAGARQSYLEAEKAVQAAQQRVLDLQERLGVLDPTSESASVMSQVSALESQLQEKRLELRQLLDNPRPAEARVSGVRGDIDRLEGLIGDLRATMTETTSGEDSLARISAELRIAETDLSNRQLLLQQAMQQLETARIEANKQVRYVSMGVEPVPPDEATYPRAFENTLVAFLIFAGIYLMISMTAAILREQVAA